MAKQEEKNAGLDRMPLDNNEEHSSEGKDEIITTLRRELEEELVVTNSLTHLVAEKTAEIEHLQKKIGDQEARIYNLEDQVEEWTTQADSCDKLLEQKDCEIEMLKKTLKIEKQQRRDLEDMTMEVGKNSILENESLEKKVSSLQAEIEKMKEDREKENVVVANEVPASVKEDFNEVASNPEILVSAEDEATVEEKKDAERKKPEIPKDEYNMDVEVLMNDLFTLIKKNEELNEEIDRLKTEQTDIVENNRNLVVELETSIVEKAAEIQHQKHEIRRLSSVVETNDVNTEELSDLEKYSQVERIREELEDRINDLESTNSELQTRLDEHEATKSSVTRQYETVKKKLQLEREQNAELNRQILEVSNLYDTYYMKCEEFEKGRIKGIENPLGDKPMETAEEEADLAASLDVVDGSLDMSVEKHESCADDESQSELVAQASDDVGRTCSEEGVKSMAENDDSNKRLTKQWSSKSDCEGHLETKSDSLLIFATKVGRLLLLVAFTFFVATTLRVHYGMEFGQILSTLLASYVFLYNAWLVCSSGRQSKAYDKDSKRVTQGLRKAIQDLIVRLDEKNFEEFSEIYEKYIVESFADEDRSVSYNVEGEVKFLRSSNEVLAKEVEKYKERNSSIHSDYNQMKREIDMVRIRRLEEDEVKEKTIQKLKGEVKSLEMQVTTKVDVASDAEMSRGFMQGSLLKLLLFAILEGMLLMSASSSLILIPASIVSVIFLVLVYRADVNLTYASNENLAYQRTVKELLRKVKEYRDEGKQTSDEVRELEAVVDKDYEIISKQRHAIERLERQLQRAINKYRDKKRMLAKFVWLQEQQVCDFVGLNSSFDAGEQHGIESVFKDAKMDPPSVNRWWFDLKTLTAVGITSAAVSVFRDYGPYFPLSNADPFHIVGAIALTSAIFIFVKRKFRESEELRIGDSKSQLRELRQDEAMMGEQVDMLRSLLSVEREFVAKIEKQLDATKEPSERRIPRSEVNAVIDRLIEVSKQRDALELSASSAKDKYDHIKKTLDDILSREKYLSEEVSALRTQKRELRNDLMKEQLKHIEMFEEVKRLKERSEKEVRNSDNHDHLEWDLDIAEYIKENEAHEAVMSSESEILLEDDAILEGLEQAGSHAQKSRRNRHAKRRHKEKGKSTREVEENNSKLVEEEEAEEKWQPQERSSRKVMDEVNEICDEMIACVEDKMVDQGATSMDQCDGEKRINGGRDDARDDVEDENYRADNSMSRDNAEVDSKAVDQESHVDENSLLMEIEKQRRLLTAKDSELEQLKVLLDTSQLSVSRENSDSGTERDYEKSNIDRVNIREFEKEIRKLAIEIFQLKELYAEPENDSDEEQRMEKISEGFINYLAERLTIFRCKFLAEKGAIIAKMNAVEENVEKAQCQIEKLNADVDKEKQARNHVITEYENEYERLESRLSEAHENIRKRLTEERSLRGEIMTQYEHEIEDMQSKTMQILRDLKEQLKQERMEKEEAKFRAEETGKKLKDLEAELKSIEETEQSNQVYSELQDLFVLQSEGKRDKTQHVIQFKKLAEEEANRRTRNLKERLDEATRSLESFRSKLKEKEERITRFEKREKALMARIDIQDKRLTDLENEVRNPGTGEEEISTSRVFRTSKDGLICNLATKNGSSQWENPSTTGLIQVTRSSAGFGNASDILDEKPLPCSTENLEDSWYQLDFGQDKAVIPEAYSLCHGWLSKDACIRNWVFEGSVDGSQWHALRKHAMDTSINDRYMPASWKVSGNHLPLRYLRVRLTGPNASNTNELYVGGIEIFGRIIHPS